MSDLTLSWLRMLCLCLSRGLQYFQSVLFFSEVTAASRYIHQTVQMHRKDFQFPLRTVRKLSFRLPSRLRFQQDLKSYGGEFVQSESEKDVLVSIGIFTIVQLERDVQMLIPAYDFCMPRKECVASSEDPCELFSSIDFPTSEFFPKDHPADKKHRRPCNEA